MLCICAPLVCVVAMKKLPNTSVPRGRVLQLLLPRHCWCRLLYSFVSAICGSGILLCV